MARGGYRRGAGRPKGSKKAGGKAAAGAAAPVVDISTPLAYMLSVMADPKADPVRRDRMAIAAAPFLHPRKEPVGQAKRETAIEKAERAAGGRFKPGTAPTLVVKNP